MLSVSILILVYTVRFSATVSLPNKRHHPQVMSVWCGEVVELVGRVVEGVGEEVARLLSCVTHWSHPHGVTQAAIDVAALQMALHPYITPTARWVHPYITTTARWLDPYITTTARWVHPCITNTARRVHP